MRSGTELSQFLRIFPNCMYSWKEIKREKKERMKTRQKQTAVRIIGVSTLQEQYSNF